MKSKSSSRNDDWETPDYVYSFMMEEFFKGKLFFDPCPLHANFDGLNMDWADRNYVNPPYSRSLKELFIKKAFEEGKKGKLCVLLIPASTDSNIFHSIIVPNAQVFLIQGRIKFKGYNKYNEFVTNKCGQSGHMFVIFGNGAPFIKTCNVLEWWGTL
jgi:hypothetical protein